MSHTTRACRLLTTCFGRAPTVANTSSSVISAIPTAGHEAAQRVSSRELIRGTGVDMRIALRLVGSAILCGTSACGGGGSATSPPTTPPPTSAPLARVSQPSRFPANCDGVASNGTLYVGAVVEPYLAVNPTSPANLIGAWQQNRWSSGGSQGLMIGASFDGGATWMLSQAATSRCTGGNAANGGDYARASDPLPPSRTTRLLVFVPSASKNDPVQSGWTV
jgi:hypothetical protein